MPHTVKLITAIIGGLSLQIVSDSNKGSKPENTAVQSMGLY